MKQFHSEIAWLPSLPLSRGGSSGRSTSSMRSSSSRSHESRLFKISCKKGKVRYTILHVPYSHRKFCYIFIVHTSSVTSSLLSSAVKISPTWDHPYKHQTSPLLLWHGNSARWNKGGLKHDVYGILQRFFLFINILPSLQLEAFWNWTTLLTWNSKTALWRDDVKFDFFRSHIIMKSLKESEGKPMLPWLFGTTKLQTQYYGHQTLLFFTLQIVVHIKLLLKGLTNHHMAWVC